tara:strand:+ start:857 stop:1834 length:978 start_codon:yes stop_codon:yes gene_type:complete
MAYTTIDDPTLYFNIKLYTGTGSSNAVTGVNFLPAFTWIKSRTTYSDHILTDVVRGVTKTIHSNSTAAQTTEAQDLKSFDSDGFTVGTNDNVNKSSDNMVAWNWKEDVAAGFDILTYEGSGSAQTISHNLGVKPNMIIVKNIDSSSPPFNWRVYNSSLGAGVALKLNATDAKSDDPGYWNDTEPTSSVFSVKDSGETNNSGQTYIAYLFAEKKGYSKFGSWIGNGSANGAFVYTGFKPAYVLVKSADGITEWFITDNKRPGHNLNYRINPNIMDAEATAASANYCDLLSNGFKVRYTDVVNERQIYMAFAEAPFVTSTGVPTTAR